MEKSTHAHKNRLIECLIRTFYTSMKNDLTCSDLCEYVNRLPQLAISVVIC